MAIEGVTHVIALSIGLGIGVFLQPPCNKSIQLPTKVECPPCQCVCAPCTLPPPGAADCTTASESQAIRDKKRDSAWQSGIANEINFHRSYIQGTVAQAKAASGFFFEERTAKLKGQSVPLWVELFCPVLKQNNVQIQLALDHGAGPLSQLGNQFTCPPPVGSARVLAVDPLAPYYHRILNAENMFNFSRTSYCPNEMLDQCFAAETFDFITSFNSLDHNVHADKSFENSVRILKQGGLVCVISIRNEADHERGMDFHQWNLDLSPGVFKFQSHADGSFTNMEEKLKARMIRVWEKIDQTTFQVCYKKVAKDQTPFDDVLSQVGKTRP